jgi:hypothetical protein
LIDLGARAAGEARIELGSGVSGDVFELAKVGDGVVVGGAVVAGPDRFGTGWRGALRDDFALEPPRRVVRRSIGRHGRGEQDGKGAEPDGNEKKSVSFHTNRMRIIASSASLLGFRAGGPR